MRILQVIPHLSKGGAERVVIELSNALVKSGHEVTLFLAFPVDSSLNQGLLDNKVNVEFLTSNPKSRGLVYLKLPYHIVKFWKVLKTHDVIHCHLTFGLIFGFIISFLRKITRTKNVRLIATCHVVGVGITPFPKILNQRLSYFFDVFALMALDNQWRNFISSNKKSNIQIVVNGISKNTLRDKMSLSTKNSFLKVGTISRLEEERKPWLFLQTFAQINKLTNGSVRYVLGGDGSEKENLIALSEKMELQGVLSMPGLINDPREILADLDVYLALNIEDITGIAGLEAVFAGVPVVGIQLAPDYTKGVNDWIWSDQDPQVVAARVSALLNSPSELADVSKNQYRVATQNFSIERMCDQYLNLYIVKK
jgi:glycosyltransferase involved in cell wall biosynthesis